MTIQDPNPGLFAVSGASPADPTQPVEVARESLFANHSITPGEDSEIRARLPIFGPEPEPEPETKSIFGTTGSKPAKTSRPKARDRRPPKPNLSPRSNSNGSGETLPNDAFPIVRPQSRNESVKAQVTDLLAKRRKTVSGKRGNIVGWLVFLGTATQLRPEGGVGIFELMLVVFMGLSLPLKAWGLHVWEHRPGRFLMLFLVVTTIGGFYNSVIRLRAEPIDVVVSFLPYMLAFIILEYASAQAEPFRFLFAFAYIFGRMVLFSQLVLFLLPVKFLGPLDLYLGGIRFRGWANNPNQLAVMLVIAVSAVGMTTVSKPVKFIGLLTGLVLGYSTLSDAWTLAAGFGLILALGVVLVKSTEVNLSYRAMGWVLMLASIGLLIMSSSQVVSIAEGVAGKRGQGSERVTLWASCIEETIDSRIGLVIGLGPTPHGLGSQGRPQECHNTPLDFLSFAGLGIVALFMSMLANLFQKSWSTGDIWGVMFLATFAVQMLFGLAARYPSLWLFLLFLALNPVGQGEKKKRPGTKKRDSLAQQSLDRALATSPG